jgi:hypothetical protein
MVFKQVTMKQLTVALIISTFSLSAFSQAAYTFRVIANKGTNQVKSGQTVQPLKAGTSLKKEDEIILGDNSYLGLVSANGKPLELKTAGNYKVSDLESKLKGGSTVLNKYTDFILSSNAEGKKNRLSATGAVHRATETSAIHVMLPDNQNANVYNANVSITWDGSKVQGPYVVTVKNMFEDKLDQFETTETNVQIDFAKYSSESAVLIDVASKANPKMGSKDYTIRRMNAADQEKVKKMLAEIQGDVAEETALNYFILAGFFEENKLFIDAIGAYEQAVKLEPSFKEAYDEFLVRNNLKK